jgi:hypothetical protein
MRTRVFLGALAFLCALAFVVPAGAVTINGVDYVLFAQCKIGMEDGPTNITGNIAVNEACGVENGLLRIGAHNIVNGTATANRMFFGTGASVTTCQTNASAGGSADNVCGNIPPDLIPFPVALPITAWPPLPVPVVVPGATDFVCAPFTTCPLPAGAYRDIKVRDGATLNLDTAGTYQARSLLVETAATLNGNGSSVNLTGGFNTEPNANVNDVTITSIKAGTAEVIEVGNGSHINNSVFYAPFARAHLHQATLGQGVEVIAVLIIVEPVTLTPPPPRGCACIGELAKGQGTIELSNGCGLNIPQDTFFVSQTCAIDASVSCPSATCIQATLKTPPPPTDDTATLNIPAGLISAPYHVIVVSPGGQFCTTSTVSLP